MATFSALQFLEDIEEASKAVVSLASRPEIPNGSQEPNRLPTAKIILTHYRALPTPSTRPVLYSQHITKSSTMALLYGVHLTGGAVASHTASTCETQHTSIAWLWMPNFSKRVIRWQPC